MQIKTIKIKRIKIKSNKDNHNHHNNNQIAHYKMSTEIDKKNLLSMTKTIKKTQRQ